MEYWIIQIKPFSPKKRNENIVLNFQKDCIRIVDARKYVPFPVNHAKFAANTAALFLLGIVVVEAPPMWILILAVGFVFMVLYNFNAVTQTLGQLRRRK